jgi:tetratricopeptide (TPR) repeat protein
MLPESRVHARQLINEGNELARAERYLEAAKPLCKAAAIARESRFEDEELQALLTLSACYHITDATKVRPTLNRALELARSLNDLIAEGKCYLNLTEVTDDKVRAAGQLRMSLSVFEKAGYSLGTAQALDNLAVCYRVIGSPRLAAFYASRARKLFHELRDPVGCAKNLRLSADLVTDLVDAGLEPADRRAEARKDYLAAMQIYQGIGASVSFANCQDVLGLLERQEGNLDVAIAHYQQAASNLAKGHAPHLLSSALLHLANAYQTAGRVQDALDTYLEVIRLKSNLGDHAGVVNARHNRAVILIDQGDYQEARHELAAVIEARFSQVRSIYYPQTMAGVLDEYAAGWSNCILASYRTINPVNRTAVIGLLTQIEQSKFNVMGRGMSLIRDAGITSPESRRRLLRTELWLRKRYRDAVLGRQRLGCFTGVKEQLPRWPATTAGEDVYELAANEGKRK